MSSQGLHDPDPTQQTHYSSQPIIATLTIILLVFFFLGFFVIYFGKSFMQNLLSSWHLRQSPADTPAIPTAPQHAPGIDPKIIKSFPTFPYSSVKGYRKEKCGLECAICLVEFGDDDVLRLLTSCCHVFHQECIDLWLERRTTCPVCRRSLDAVESPEKSPISFTRTMRLINEHEQEHDGQPSQDSVSITIKDEGEDDESGGNGGGERSVASITGADDHVGDDEEHENKFPRSHSTGHSIVRNRENDDRYTLRLPEHVQAKILRGHNPSKSCTTFGEFKSKGNTGNGGFGEVSGSSVADNIDRV